VRRSFAPVDDPPVRSNVRRDTGRSSRHAEVKGAHCPVRGYAGTVGRRWDIDERGRGVADARHFADGARELVDAMVEEDWVAEDPDAHLLPHIRRACERDGAPLSESCKRPPAGRRGRI
jgi:hypothetical protein